MESHFVFSWRQAHYSNIQITLLGPRIFKPFLVHINKAYQINIIHLVLSLLLLAILFWPNVCRLCTRRHRIKMFALLGFMRNSFWFVVKQMRIDGNRFVWYSLMIFLTGTPFQLRNKSFGTLYTGRQNVNTLSFSIPKIHCNRVNALLTGNEWNGLDCDKCAFQRFIFTI